MVKTPSMVKYCYLISFGLWFLLLSCEQKSSDIFYQLSPSQTTFINTVKAGDTCIWENSLGLRDTAIVQPVIRNEKYTVLIQGNTTTYGAFAYYLYKFVGTKNTKIGDGVAVNADCEQSNIRFMGTSWIRKDNKGTHTKKALGILKTKIIGALSYRNVYWQIPILKSESKTDTVFWNEQGILGYRIAGETLKRIK